jgi:hypothetical protein
MSTDRSRRSGSRITRVHWCAVRYSANDLWVKTLILVAVWQRPLSRHNLVTS